MSDSQADRTVEKLLRQQKALAEFGSFAFHESDLNKILTEAARICAHSLDVPFSKICRYRAAEGDLLIEAGWGWNEEVVGRVVSQADESSPQGRAYITGKPVIIRNVNEANNLNLPPFYEEHKVVSTVDVLIPALGGEAYGVLEIDSTKQHQYDEHDITFLAGFANELAEAVATVGRVRALREALVMRDLLAEELQHRVRNNLQMVSGMLEAYARTAPEGTSRDGVRLIVSRVATLAQVYDSLLGVGLSGSIELGGYLRALCLRLSGTQPEGAHPVRLVCEAAPMMLPLDHVTAVGMAVAELVTNSYGHAFPDQGGTISMTLIRRGPAQAQVVIRDDGVGLGPQHGGRRGMGLVRRLIGGIGGSLAAGADESGTAWTLSFPVSDPGLPPAA